MQADLRASLRATQSSVSTETSSRVPHPQSDQIELEHTTPNRTKHTIPVINRINDHLTEDTLHKDHVVCPHCNNYIHHFGYELHLDNCAPGAPFSSPSTDEGYESQPSIEPNNVCPHCPFPLESHLAECPYKGTNNFSTEEQMHLMDNTPADPTNPDSDNSPLSASTQRSKYSHHPSHTGQEPLSRNSNSTLVEAGTLTPPAREPSTPEAQPRRNAERAQSPEEPLPVLSPPTPAFYQPSTRIPPSPQNREH